MVGFLDCSVQSLWVPAESGIKTVKHPVGAPFFTWDPFTLKRFEGACAHSMLAFPHLYRSFMLSQIALILLLLHSTGDLRYVVFHHLIP